MNVTGSSEAGYSDRDLDGPFDRRPVDENDAMRICTRLISRAR
jgi:hypothetical protein